jgi:dipeptide transport system ATP-binding protein
MGLLPANGRVATGRILYEGSSLEEMPEDERRKLRGGRIAMIFQDPMSALNPSFTVGFQLEETVRLHASCGKREARKRAIGLLEQVGIPSPSERLSAYPHQLSGGMCQRVMIAMALACEPKLLIADEPTTALDVTVQAQILDLLARLVREKGMALILITHDLGIVAEMADRVMVMYAGQVVESGLASEVIERPRHPYTRGLLESLPSSHDSGGSEHRAKLPSIPGLVPDLLNRPHGCQLSPRCGYADEKCREELPSETVSGDRLVKCFKPLDGGSVHV